MSYFTTWINEYLIDKQNFISISIKNYQMCEKDTLKNLKEK